MLGLDSYEVLPSHAIPARYGSGLSDDAVAVTGDVPDLNEETTELDPVVGSGPELGGQSTVAATSGSTGIGNGLTEADDVNFTGMTESPMIANANGPNINGSGVDAQQLPSRSFSPQSVQQVVSDVTSSISKLGSSLAGSFTAPRKTTPGAMQLQQTSQAGLSFGANFFLFFILGAILALVIFEG
jgi:hypothetical protein